MDYIKIDNLTFGEAVTVDAINYINNKFTLNDLDAQKVSLQNDLSVYQGKVSEYQAKIDDIQSKIDAGMKVGCKRQADFVQENAEVNAEVNP